MKDSIIFLIINIGMVFFFILPSWAAFPNTPLATRPLGMGYAFVAVADDINATHTNPAGLALMTGACISSDYTQVFGLSELTYGQITSAVSTKWGSFGLGYNQFGDELYHEQIVSLSYARRVWKKLAMGINLHGYQLEIDGHGDASSYGIDTGILIIPRADFRMGAYLHNFNQPKIGQDQDDIPHSYTVGIAYIPMKNSIIALDAHKDLDFSLSYRVGVEYNFADNVFLRTGLQTEPGRFFGGLGFQYRFFRFDYAFASHPTLGETHHIGVMIHWN